MLLIYTNDILFNNLMRDNNISICKVINPANKTIYRFLLNEEFVMSFNEFDIMASNTKEYNIKLSERYNNRLANSTITPIEILNFIEYTINENHRYFNFNKKISSKYPKKILILKFIYLTLSKSI